MERDEIRRILEALIFVSDKPVSVDTLREVMKDVDPADIRALVVELNNEYAAGGRSFTIKELAGGFLMMTDPVFSQWVAALFKKKPERLSGPAMETLAIIAYKQPITRSEIEAIRGVNVERILHNLEARTLIKVKGRLEAPGRPILYGTTNQFLQHFGLKSLEELPNLREFQESELDFIKERERARLMNMETGALQEGTSATDPESFAAHSGGEHLGGENEGSAAAEEAEAGESVASTEEGSDESREAA